MLVAVPPENRPRMCGMHSRPLKHLFDGGSVGVSLSQSWRDLLLDLKRRGLATASQIAVADGALRFWKALGEVWPTTREQRCWVHKTANICTLRPSARCRRSGWPRL